MSAKDSTNSSATVHNRFPDIASPHFLTEQFVLCGEKIGLNKIKPAMLIPCVWKSLTNCWVNSDNRQEQYEPDLFTDEHNRQEYYHPDLLTDGQNRQLFPSSYSPNWSFCEKNTLFASNSEFSAASTNLLSGPFNLRIPFM